MSVSTAASLSCDLKHSAQEPVTHFARVIDQFLIFFNGIANGNSLEILVSTYG